MLGFPQPNMAGSRSLPAYQTKNFVSAIDGSEDTFALTCPSGKNHGDLTLLVYLHGLGEDFNEPFNTPPGKSIASSLTREFPNMAILSPNYGKKPSWGTKLARTDISSNIAAVMQEHHVERIILAGSSMGACTALLYACTAPKDIKDKIVGIIAAYPASDLAELHKVSETPLVQSSLEAALSGKPSEAKMGYRQNSLESQLPFFPRYAKVSIISATENTVMPDKFAKEVARLLKNRDIQVKFIDIPGDLQAPPVESMVESAQFLLH